MKNFSFKTMSSVIIFIFYHTVSICQVHKPIKFSTVISKEYITVLNKRDTLALESFETGSFDSIGWKTITGNGGTGWQIGEVDSLVPGFGEGFVFDAPVNGGRSVAYTSWATGDSDGNLSTGQPTDQWLITPQIVNIQSGDMLTFYLSYFFGRGDTLDVLISRTGSNIEDFDTRILMLSFFGPGNNAWKQYSYTLSDTLTPGSNIYIAFREHVANTAVEGDALFLDLVEVTSMTTDVDDLPEIPSEFILRQNYPNPFNPETAISYQLSATSDVELTVFDRLGRAVTVLVNAKHAAGEHRVLWDGNDATGNKLPSGIYLYRLRAGAFVQTRKMVLAR